MPGKVAEQDYYEILAISSSESTRRYITKQDIKLGYRRALLLHHPDKSTPSKASQPTIDEIILAYKTLSNPKLRAEYDRILAFQVTSTDVLVGQPHPGLETVDLDEMHYDDEKETWYRGCRCGKDRAYVVTEQDLESNTEHGELVTGCQGCSLWMKVSFAVAENV